MMPPHDPQTPAPVPSQPQLPPSDWLPMQYVYRPLAHDG